MNWETGIAVYTLLILCIRYLVRAYCITQGTLLRALWYPKREGNLKNYMYIHTHTYSLCCTVETNTVKQLYYNKIFLMFYFCFLCIICVESTINQLQYSEPTSDPHLSACCTWTNFVGLTNRPSDQSIIHM